MSRKGRGRFLPPSRTWIRPSCSTTKSNFGKPGAPVTSTGLWKEPTCFRATPLPALAEAPSRGARSWSLAEPQAGSASVSTAARTAAAVEALLAFLDFNDFAAVVDFGFRRLAGDDGGKRAAGGDVAAGDRLRLVAEPGADAVEQVVLAGANRAQLPDRLRRLARLQRPEGEGLAARGRAAAGIGGALQAWVGRRQHPDRPFRLRQSGLRVVDGERQRRGFTLVAGDREADVEERDRVLAGVADRELQQRGLPEGLLGGERGFGHLDVEGPFRFVDLARAPAAAGAEQHRRRQRNQPGRDGLEAGAPGMSSDPPQIGPNIPRGLPAFAGISGAGGGLAGSQHAANGWGTSIP